MKIYLFYLRETSELYAHTIYKPYRKCFLKERNPEKIYEKIKYIDDIEYSAFLSKHHKTKLIEIPLEDCDGVYTIIGTEYEEDSLSSSIERMEDVIEYMRNYLLSDNIFNERYKKLLNSLMTYYIIDDMHSSLRIDTLHLFYHLHKNTFDFGSAKIE